MIAALTFSLLCTSTPLAGPLPSTVAAAAGQDRAQHASVEGTDERRASLPSGAVEETRSALPPTLLAVGAAGFFGPMAVAGLVGGAGYAAAQLPGLRHTARSVHWQMPAVAAVAGAIAAALASFGGLGAGVAVTAFLMAPPADALAVVGAGALSGAGAAAVAGALSVTVVPALALLALLPLRPGPRASRFSRSLYGVMLPAATLSSAAVGLAVVTPVSAAFAFWVGGAAFAQHRHAGGAALAPGGAE